MESYRNYGIDHKLRDHLSMDLLSKNRVYTDISVTPPSSPKSKGIYSLINIHTYHSRFSLEGVAKASQIFLRDAHVLQKLFSYGSEAFDRLSQVFAINPLIAFCDIHERKREVLFFFVPDTTRDFINIQTHNTHALALKE
jgi:hypothetical protein